jgi:hypothetical protein
LEHLAEIDLLLDGPMPDDGPAELGTTSTALRKRSRRLLVTLRRNVMADRQDARNRTWPSVSLPDDVSGLPQDVNAEILLCHVARGPRRQ